MQKKRIVVGITAIVVLALLFAGMGYAFNGSARTYNQGDDQTLAYMSITPENFNPIFTGDTIFDTYVYEGATTSEKKTAYAFNETAETVVDLTVSEIAYKAVKIGTKNMTVLNNTGNAITALNIEITANGTTGNTDFVYIFKITGTDAAKYVVFNGTSLVGSVAGLTAAIADATSEDVTIDVYIGYVPNAYVPSDYIGPAADNAAGYAQAAYWKEGVQYYSDKSGTTASPTEETFDEGTYYQKYTTTLPYKQSESGPIDLSKTDFSFKVTDATA